MFFAKIDDSERVGGLRCNDNHRLPEAFAGQRAGGERGERVFVLRRHGGRNILRRAAVAPIDGVAASDRAG